MSALVPSQRENAKALNRKNAKHPDRSTMSLPGYEGDHRDPKVRRAILDRLFSGEKYVPGQENTEPADENVEPQEEPKAGESDKPYAPEGYMLAPLVMGNNYVGLPQIVVPITCLICSKFGDHLAENCPHRNDEKYIARFKFGSDNLLDKIKYSKEDL